LHSPAVCPDPSCLSSGSSCAGNTPPLQAHLVLDNSSPLEHLTPRDTLQIETGKDIDRRTNTTVSWPGQFSSCSPNNVVIHCGWLPAQQPSAVSPARRGKGRVADVGQALSLPSRHSCRLLRRHSCRRKRPSRKPAEPEDHPEAAVFCVSRWRRLQGSINRSKRRLYKHQSPERKRRVSEPSKTGVDHSESR